MQNSLNQTIRLSRHALHLWSVDPDQLSTEQLSHHFDHLLNIDEKERYNRFVFDRDRHTFLVARSLLRLALSRYEDVLPHKWKFAVNDYGKPRIQEPQPTGLLHFNLTHSKGLVALAVSQREEVGVDAEYIRESFDWLAIAKDFFTEEEVAQLESLDKSEQVEAFFQYWTMKEAFIKARGLGLSIPLNSFRFDCVAECPQIHFSDTTQDNTSHWQILIADSSPNHRLTVAVQDNHSVTLETFSGLTLLKSYPATVSIKP